jgi:aminopeptidase N
VVPTLTRDEAAARAAVISVDAYRLDLDLSRGDRTFSSHTTIEFRCARPGGSTFADLRPRSLRSATLNGEPLDPATLADGRLPLPDLAGHNTLVVEAEMDFTNTGQGMHRFVDPADGLAYVYAAMFLDEAATVFACFDQPDLKAPYDVRVTADPAWTVAGNGVPEQVSPGVWQLATTPPLATYFVTVVAGPYHRITGDADGVPLALYARASLAGPLAAQADEILGVTRACLRRYHELFGVRYPFGEYAQAFVPEFTMGAMENPGCVTFRDEYIFTSAVTDAEREDRAIVIAHEMAHMWFGDLVTMRWWDDLWLNESFAEYLGHRVTVEATEFRDAWTTFSVGRKAWGYAADQRPSTHPVSADVADTAQALLNFDGISYAKGAAVLRQLVAVLGDDAFLAGLRAHFAAHAYGNATLADLLDALSESSGRDLSSWAKPWLRTAGVSTLRPQVTIGADGRYTSVAIVQTAPQALRPHRLAVATYAGEPGPVVRTATVDVELDAVAVTDVPELAGRPAGDLLLVNDGDLTFAKVRLDPRSLERLPDRLPRIRDSLTRALLWGAAWDATRDAELPADAFVDLVVAGLPAETDVAMAADVLGYATDYAIARYLPSDRRTTGWAALGAACRSMLAAAPPGSGHQLTAARGLIRCAGPDDIDMLRGWLDTSRPAGPGGLAIDADLRWLVVTRLAVLGAVDDADIDAEYVRDHTATGAEHAACARAARPDPTAKALAWDALVHDDTSSNRILFANASGFWQPDQDAVTAPYVDRYIIDMPVLAARRPSQVTERIASAAFPAYAVDTRTLARLTAMRDDGSMVPALRRSLVDETDELDRSVRARALVAADGAADRGSRR